MPAKHCAIIMPKASAHIVHASQRIQECIEHRGAHDEFVSIREESEVQEGWQVQKQQMNAYLRVATQRRDFSEQ